MEIQRKPEKVVSNLEIFDAFNLMYDRRGRSDALDFDEILVLINDERKKRKKNIIRVGSEEEKRFRIELDLLAQTNMINKVDSKYKRSSIATF